MTPRAVTQSYHLIVTTPTNEHETDVDSWPGILNELLAVSAQWGVPLRVVVIDNVSGAFVHDTNDGAAGQA